MKSNRRSKLLLNESTEDPENKIRYFPAIVKTTLRGYAIRCFVALSFCEPLFLSDLFLAGLFTAY